MFSHFRIVLISIITLSLSFSTTLLNVDFETEGSGYTPSATEGSGWYDVFNRSNPNKGGNETYMWAFEDFSTGFTDPTITLDQINVSGYESFSFSIDMLAHHMNDWDNGSGADNLKMFYSLDGGEWQNLMWVLPLLGESGAEANEPAALDADFDGVSECDHVLPSLSLGTGELGCVVSSDLFQTFTTGDFSLNNTSTLDIKLEFTGFSENDAGGYLDNIVVSGTLPSGATCDEETACNYGSEGACTYADTNEDCAGNCLDGFPADCAGVCGGSTPDLDTDGICDSADDDDDGDTITDDVDCDDSDSTVGAAAQYYDCAGVCLTDADSDSLCDEVDDCVEDPCGTCGGDGTACMANIFFSEAGEGSSNNKYWEIYNATDAVVDLSLYSLSSCSNGCDTVGQWDYPNNLTFDSGTTVDSGDVFVICNSQSSSEILAQCDLQTTWYYYSTGDDVFALTHVWSGSVIDVVGMVGEAPQTGGWDVAGVAAATKDHTLVRKSSVLTGNPLWLDNSDTGEQGSAGDDADDSEWIVYDQNTWDYIGSHTYDGPATDVAGCMDSNATNYDSNATTQTYNQYGTSTCTYASCSDIPDGDPNVDGAQGCLWVDGTSSMMWATDANGNQTGLAWWQCPTVCGLVQVNFELDLADDVTGTTPHVNGTYNGWCGSCYNDMSDSDGDGIWNHTQYFPSGQFIEYKFSMDGWALAETDYAGTPLGSCFNEYTNRSFTAGDINTSMTLASCFGSCDATCSSSDDGGTDGGSTPTCDDGVQNQDEIGVDCGGSCAACATAGCMDMNASNYDSSATVDAYDANGNLLCVYNSDCSNVPDDGCVYAESFGTWTQWFNWQDCYNYGGTPCAVGGCMDSGADNYDATATEQSYDSYGNQLCTYSSCDDVPQDGCIYAGVHTGYDPLPSYAPFNDGDDGIAGNDDDFDAEECQLWGTACVTAPAQSDNLFFSEAAEGSSDNKYLEIYNPTDADIDLSGYLLGNTSNAPNTSSCEGASENNQEACETAGGTWTGSPEYFLSLTGSIVAGDVYAICDPDFAGDITLCDQTHFALSNGDDGYCLLLGTETSYTILDCVGDWNGDPGSGWSVAGEANATKDHTLVRKSSVTTGNPDWNASAGTTEEDSEWVVLDQNTWNYLGSHPHSFDAVCDDATACNYLESGDCVFANTGEDCDGNTLYTLTFSVNMTYAGDIDTSYGVRVFGSWGLGWSSTEAASATCDENDVCTASIDLPAGDYFYKFRNGWSYENVDDLSCAALDGPNADGFSYWNRTVTISTDETLDTVCFGVCADCIGGCTDSSASNTDDNANVDDGSCEYTQPVANLFFSEYTEGSSNNKYLEIYNASNDTVTLGNYAYPSTANAPDVAGQHEYWNTFDDGASIAPGDVYVICHGSFAGDQTLCDEFHTYLSNGDDGYCLVYGPEADYELLDCIGDFNGDPGSGWDVAGVAAATKDHTLVRKSDVTTGNDGYWEASAGTEDDDSEWHVIDMNNWTFLGSHPNTLVYGCTDVGANNTTDGANVDDGSCTYPTVSFTADMNCADYTPVDGDVVHVQGMNTGWGSVFTDLSDDDGDGIWTGSGSISAGTWEWKLSVGHWNNDTQTWNAWEAQEDLTNLTDCAATTDGQHWNRVTVVTDSDVSETVTYGSCTDCASCADLTCENSWESCVDVAYTDPVCECIADGNINGDSNGEVNVTDIIAIVNWIMACQNDITCFTPEQLCYGDLNNDDTVGVGDVIALVNIILADRVSYDDASSANIVLTNNAISIDSDGHVAGIQMTLNHGSNFSLELTEAYVSEYNTIGNKTTLLIVSIDNSLEEIATYKGSIDIESIILYNSTNEISDINIVNVSPVEVKLAGPNPFNPSTSLNIVVAQDGFVSVNVYNLIGQKVATLLSGYMDANLNGYPVNFNGSNLASGVYLVRAETAGNVSTQKLMLLK